MSQALGAAKRSLDDKVVRLYPPGQPRPPEPTVLAFQPNRDAATSVSRSELEQAVSLCSRILGGDRKAETELDNTYRQRLIYLLSRRAAPADVEDLVQRALIETIVRLRSKPLDNPAGLGGFLYRTAMNMQNADRRTVHRRATYFDTDYLDTVAAVGEDQEQELIRAADAALLRGVLMQLEPERYRELLVRYYLHQESKDSVCAAMELSSLHFNRVLYRAKNALRKIMIEARDRLGDQP